MRTRILFLILTILVAFPAAAQTQGWNPPETMAWDTPNKKCLPTRLAGPLIEGCYFGPVANPTDHVGLAFFRKCGPYRQKDPFLIVDFLNSKVTFFAKPGAGATFLDLPKNGEIDPEPFYELLPSVDGPCWAKPGTDV